MTAHPLRAAREDECGYALVGDPDAHVLAGPSAAEGAESLRAHLARLGPLPSLDRADIVAEIEGSGLVGRGGGGFPITRKIAAVNAAAQRRGVTPLVVVNGSESEPASRKDRTLLALRPHLVLDGAVVAAHAVGADEIVVHLHGGSTPARRAVEAALAERRGARCTEPAWRLTVGPDRYVAGESSAVVHHIDGGAAKPLFTRVPVAEVGIGGRPTLLNNVETIAHLGLIARTGAAAWRASGPSPWTGPTLVTLHGAVRQPGVVVEITGRVTVGRLLGEIGGVHHGGAVLVGGYAGRWLPFRAAAHLVVDRASMTAAGAPPGCGLLAVIPDGVCGIAETARIAGWLAGESAGQCGPCAFGLPALAGDLGNLVVGRGGRRTLRRIRSTIGDVEGRGACRHPDGVVALVTSALVSFADDVDAHTRGRPCAGVGAPSVLPLPGFDGASP